MKSSTRLLLLLLLCVPLFAADKIKLEEGRYGRLQKGALVPGSEHSWILWQLPDGALEVQDHFEEYKPLLIWSRGLYSMGDDLLKDAIRKEIVPTDLSAILTSDGRLLSLKVDGVTAFGKEGTGLNCHISENSTECKTAEEKAKVKTSNTDGFFWWFKFPLIIGEGSACSTAGSSGVVPKKVAFLSLRGQTDKKQPKIDEKALPVADSEWGNTPHLEVASLDIVNLGKDTLTLGDHAFNNAKMPAGD